MTAIDFGHTSDPGRTGFESLQRLVNAFSEQLGKLAKTSLPIYVVPGTSRFDQGSSGLTGPCRGMLYVYGKGLYVVSGASVAFFDSSGNPSAVTGSSISGSGPVFMAANQASNAQIGVVTSDNKYYVINTGAATVSKPDLSASLPPPNYITFIDGYFVFAIPDGRFFQSNINDALTVNALAFASKQSKSDGLQACVTFRGVLLVIGQTSMEIWEDAGTTPFAFARIRASIDVGCISSATIERLGEDICWVDQFGAVRRMSASQPERISTFGLERLIEALTINERRALFATTYQLGTHLFYALTSSYWTWVFDASTGLWAERVSDARLNWFAVGSETFPDGRAVVGSQIDGSLHLIDATSTTESGSPLTVIAQSQLVHAFPKGLAFHELAVDFVPGVGVTGGDNQAANPQLVLEWTDDGGATWVGGLQASIGRVGERNAIASFYGLGACGRQGRTFRLSCSASVMRSLLNADARTQKIAV